MNSQQMSNSEEDVTTVNVCRKRVSKTIKIKNISELTPGEKITFDVPVDKNVYILSIGTRKNESLPFIYFSIDAHKDNVKRNLAISVTLKDMDSHPFFHKSYSIGQNSVSQETKYTVRDIPAGSLIFQLELSCLSWTTEEISQVKKTISYDRMENLSSDLGRLYSERTNSDVVIQVGKAQIPVHSQILSARSEVFAAMFRHDMTEKLEKVIQISDISELAMHYFLVFIYTGKLEKMADFRPDTLKELYSAADKYAVMELKEMISDILLSDISLKTVASCACLAIRHCDQRMREAVIRFISRNLGILDSTQWRELETTYPLVAAEVLNIVCNKGIALR